MWLAKDGLLIEHHLFRPQMLSKSLTGEEIASEVVSCLSVTYGIATDHVITAMRDRASTNNVAMNTSPSGYRVLLPYFRSDRRAVCGPYSQ